jgi:hypothetical protein
MKTITAIFALFCIIATSLNASGVGPSVSKSSNFKFNVDYTGTVIHYSGGQSEGGSLDLGVLEITNWKQEYIFPTSKEISCFVDGATTAHINLSCQVNFDDPTWDAGIYFLDGNGVTIQPSSYDKTFSFNKYLDVDGVFNFTIGIHSLKFNELPMPTADGARKKIIVTCTSSYIN